MVAYPNNNNGVSTDEGNDKSKIGLLAPKSVQICAEKTPPKKAEKFSGNLTNEKMQTSIKLSSIPAARTEQRNSSLPSPHTQTQLYQTTRLPAKKKKKI